MESTGKLQIVDNNYQGGELNFFVPTKDSTSDFFGSSETTEAVSEQTSETTSDIPSENPKEVSSETPSEVISEPISEKNEVVNEEPSKEVKETFDPFAELGFTEEKDKKFVQQLTEAYKENKLQEFLDKSTKDYDKIPDVDILKMKIERENPSLDKEDLDFLLETALEKYGITGDEEDDAKALRMLRIDLKKTREELKQEQEAYKITAYERKPDPKAEQQAKEYAEYLESIDKNPAFDEFVRDKSLKFGDFNVPLDEKLDLRAVAKDPSLLLQSVLDDNGNVDPKVLANMTLAKNLPDIIEKAIKYGQSLGKKSIHDELRGADPKTHASPPPSEKPRIRILN